MSNFKAETIRVTLIDDNVIFRTIFNNMLTGFPDQPIEVTTYDNALDFLEQVAPDSTKTIDSDFLFVDINMPFMTGWELMDKFNTETYCFPKKTAIYIISSSASKSDKQQIFNYPFITGYILKPVSKSELFEIIRKETCID